MKSPQAHRLLAILLLFLLASLGFARIGIRELTDHLLGRDAPTSGTLPGGDLNFDGIVNFKDFAIMAANWLKHEPPGDFSNIPGGEYQMGDHFGVGTNDETPVHAVYFNSFFLGMYEVTNDEYVAFLNDALAYGEIQVVGGVVYGANDIGNNHPLCDTRTADLNSQINYTDDTFTVNTKKPPSRCACCSRSSVWRASTVSGDDEST